MSHKKLPRQKIIRYKIVKKYSRYSCTISGKSKYGLKYIKGQDVYALPETIGAICFTSKKYAKKFIQRHFYFDNNCMVIRVIPLGKGHFPEFMVRPKELKYFYSEDLNVKYDIDDLGEIDIPRGSICYPGVHVLD